MKAAKRKSIWLLLIVSAFSLCMPALASSHPFDFSKTRAELKTDSGPNRVEFVAVTPETASSYYDPFGEVALESSVAPKRIAGAVDKAVPQKFTDRLADYNQNPGAWRPQSIHVEPAISIRARGGVSEQIIYRNTQTGETLIRHRVTDARGRLLDDHFRPNYKPRIGEVD